MTADPTGDRKMRSRRKMVRRIKPHSGLDPASMRKPEFEAQVS